MRSSPAVAASAGGGLQSRLRTWLVAGQIALACPACNAGLLFRSFARLSGEQPGFDASDLSRSPLFAADDLHRRAALVNITKNLQPRMLGLPASKVSAWYRSCRALPKANRRSVYPAGSPPAKRRTPVGELSDRQAPIIFAWEFHF